MSVEVVIPFAGGCEHRERALYWVRDRYRWPVCVSEGSDPWVKAQAVNPAVQSSDADIIVLADADVWAEDLGAAVCAVEQGAGWAVPHRHVYRLTEHSTSRVLAGEDWRGLPTIGRPYIGVAGGGYVVARRETLLDVPMDPRFVGWGQEDLSHALALVTLHGAPWRGRSPLVHLYHPPQQRMTRKVGSPAGKALCHRYRRAKGNPDAMRALLHEFDPASQPDLLPDPAL